MKRTKIYLLILFSLAIAEQAYSQSKKFNIQTTFPSSLTICGKADSLVFEIRNISSSSISTIFLTIGLPSGCYYQPSSLKASGASQSNISNLNTPVFKLTDFTLAGYLRLSVKVTSTCDLQSFISKGNQATPQLSFVYSGGTESHTTGSLNVNIPNILLNTITNQIKNAYLNDKFVREITLKNTGKGGAANITFYRTNANGLKVRSSRLNDKYSVDSIISKLDSNDFKLVGNKDNYLDANEEVKISDTVAVIKCNNLTSIYTVKFGCGNTVCNISTKNAIVNFDPFIQGLTIIPKTTIDWCFDINKPTFNEIRVINNSNKPINNTIVNILQSYNGGFYNLQMSAIDTQGMTVTKGKYGVKLGKKFTSIRYNNGTSYFSCLGTLPIGGFSLMLGSFKEKDTIYVSWKSVSCMSTTCNTTTTAHRWTYSASYYDTCSSNYIVAENWGSGGGIQYMTSTPWIPTDIVSGVPNKLNYTLSAVSLFPLTNKSKFSIKLTLQAGLKNSLNLNDFKFTDIYGAQWKPYKVSINGADIIADFYKPTITLAKSELDISIEADCKAYNPSGIKTYSVSILYSPDTTCNSGKYFQLLCNNGSIKVHCTKSCSNGGMLFKSFNVKRKNYGKPDNNNDGLADATGALDFSRVKSNRSLVYDTLSTFYSGIVMSSGSANLFFDGRIKTSVLNGSLLKPLLAILTIYRNGKVRYSCNKLPVYTYTSGTTRYCEIDLNSIAAKAAGCGTMTNYFFLNSDSVVVNLNYVYSTNIGAYSGEAFFDNPEYYLSTTPNPSASQKLQCDSFSGRHILLGSYFTNYSTENYSASSCNPVTLYNSYYFSAGNCCDNYVGGNPFPFEYRNFNYLDKIKVALPKGYTFSSAAIYYYRSAGTSNYSTSYSSNIKPIINSGDSLVFNLDTFFNLTKGIYKRSDEGYQGTFVLNLTPGCNAAINTYETVKYSSYFKWTDAGVTDLVENYPDNLQFTHPSILVAAINTLSVSKKDTFSWDIIISNTKSGSNISNLWLANTMLQKAKILAIKDLTTNSFLASKNGIFKSGILSSTAARSFRIFATTKNCNLDSFKMAVGWNCDSYPDSLEAYSCKNLLTYVNLILSPYPPLIISTLLEDTSRTDVCTNRKYQAIIANVDEDNIYQLKLRVTIPPGTSFVDTGIYYSFPYGSKFVKLRKPILVTGTTYEWALSDSLSVLKNGLEKVSDTTKSRILLQFLLETNCQITAGAFVSIMPEGKIGCGEPVRRIGFTGRPIKIKGVDNPYYSLIKLSPDSINLCNPWVAFKSKIIYLGPTNTLANDSLILALPIGFIPDTASLSTVRIIGRGIVTNVNGEMRWSWAIPKGLLPGDSSMLDFKINITNKAPSCGTEAFTMQSVTKKKAYCVKSKDSCDINVATGSFYKALKIDRAEPVMKLIKSLSVNAGDSGEIIDMAFSVINNKKPIDTSMSTSFYLIIDKNANNKYDKTDVVVKKFIKTNGWLYKQQINFSFNGFVKNIDVCRLIIVSDTNNCQCLKNVLPLLNIQLKNAGRDTGFCSNYSVSIGLDSIKKYKYEWLPSTFLSSPFKSKTIYKKSNLTTADQIKTYLLKTTRTGGCFSYDTVVITTKPFITLPKLKDTSSVCFGNFTQLGDSAKGGKGLLTFNWTPNTSLNSSTKMIVFANPKTSIKYYLTVKDQNNCSIKDSTYVNVAKLPVVNIGYSGFCEKKDIKFFDQSNYFGQQKGTTLWRINFNNVTQSNPTFVFDTIGLYFVRLIATNLYGCSDSTYKYIKVFGNPNVSNTKLNQCLGDSVKLSDKTTVARMGVKNVIWKFATDSLIGKTVSKVFTKSGKYYFKQIATSDSGCITSFNDSIFIFDNPKAGFNVGGKCMNDSFRFNDKSNFNTPDSIITYRWNIKNTIFNTKQTAYKFDTTGSFNITYKITTIKGCSDSIKKIMVVNAVPKATFNIFNYCPYDTIKPSNLSTISSGQMKIYDWKITTVYSSKLISPIITPIKEGNYTINLKVISDSGCIDSSQKTFIVYPKVIVKSLFSKACESDSMFYSDISIQGNAKILGRVMSNMAGWFPDSTASFPVNSKGIFNYRVHIGTINGCDFIKDSVYEVLEKPKANFISNSPCNDNFVKLNNKSNPGAKTSLVSSQWFFNNILINSNDSFSWKFTTSGIQPITLKVQNTFGCKDSITIPIQSENPNYANFSLNDACPNDSVFVKFTGYTGTNIISDYNLSWGDGNLSKTIPTTHIFKNTGNYTVKLSIATYKGCDYDTTKSVTIYPVPNAAFDYFPKYPDVKYPTITITDKSSGSSKWYYSFGDSSSSIVQNPIYSFKDSGSYYINQIVENQFGCIDTAYLRVYVNFLLLTFVPNAFSPNNDDINQLFQPSGLGIKDFKLTIFNRWGEKIFYPDWGRKAWDGHYNGEIVQTGLYPYYIELIDYGNVKHNYHGVVNVIR